MARSAARSGLAGPGRRLAVALALAAAVAAPGARSAGAARVCEAATAAEAQALAERAAAFLDNEGPKRAFTAFMTPDGGFIDRDLYVFVIDFHGVLWANGAFPDAVGSEAIDAHTEDGRYFIRDMIALAGKRGAGWVEYEWYSPCTGELEPKVSYVIRVGRFIIGVGAYGTLGA
jgi:cytochrome c